MILHMIQISVYVYIYIGIKLGVTMYQNNTKIYLVLWISKAATCLELPVYIDYKFYRSHVHLYKPIKVKHIEIYIFFLHFWAVSNRVECKEQDKRTFEHICLKIRSFYNLHGVYFLNSAKLEVTCTILLHSAVQKSKARFLNHNSATIFKMVS